MTPTLPQPAPFPLPTDDAMRNLLARVWLKQKDRRFDDAASLTDFGALT